MVTPPPYVVKTSRTPPPNALVGSAAAGHLDVAVDDHRVPAGGPDRDEGAAAEADHAGLGGQRHERRRQRGVDGSASVGGHAEAGRQGLRSGGRHGDPLTRHGRSLACPGHVGEITPSRMRELN